MTDPSIDPAPAEHLDDHALLEAYERTSGEPGSPQAEALLAEIRRRELDV